MKIEHSQMVGTMLVITDDPHPDAEYMHSVKEGIARLIPAYRRRAPSAPVRSPIRSTRLENHFAGDLPSLRPGPSRRSLRKVQARRAPHLFRSLLPPRVRLRPCRLPAFTGTEHARQCIGTVWTDTQATRFETVGAGLYLVASRLTPARLDRCHKSRFAWALQSERSEAMEPMWTSPRNCAPENRELIMQSMPVRKMFGELLASK